MGGTTALTYSLATRVDLLAMARLLTHFLDDPLLRPWTPSALQSALADPEQNLCVARAGHTLVGIAAMRYGQRHAELTLLAVAPLWQRRGLGQGLLAWLEAPAELLGLAHSTVSCPLERSGYFSRRGFQPRFPDDPGPDPILFLRPLTRRSS